MPEGTLLVSATIGAGGALLYAYLARRLSEREVSSQAQPALQLFATWWITLAGSQVATGASEVLAWAGVDDVGLHAGLVYVNLFFVIVGIYALVYYLVYLYAGKMVGFTPVTLLYLGYFLVVLYMITTSDPSQLRVDPWTVAVDSADPISGPGVNLIVALLLLPPVVAALFYLRLYRHVETRTQRYRVVVIGTSIVLWFGSTLVVYLAGIEQAAVWPLISKLLALAGALAAFAAYFPPRWLRERGILPLGAQDLEGQAGDGRGPAGA